MANLTLYVKTGCPFCQKVKDYLDSENISVETKNISENSENREELVKAGGKQQVPCLIHDGQALYESDDIIQWFKDNHPS